jgi:thiol-disulfide isomerase/thioredoxin
MIDLLKHEHHGKILRLPFWDSLVFEKKEETLCIISILFRKGRIPSCSWLPRHLIILSFSRFRPKKIHALDRMHRTLILFTLLLVMVLLRSRMYEGFEGEELSVVICKADWCGHCQKAAPEFEKLVSASPLKLSNGKTATVKMLDADKDKDEMNQYKVRGFPTILIVKGGENIEYPGERTYDGVLDFMNKM